MKKITGYFQSVYDAQKTYNQLQNQGYAKVTIDIIDRFSKSTDKDIDNVLGGRAEGGSLSNLVLKPGEGEIPMELRSIYAADPNVSGMGKMEEVADANIIVTVTIEDSEENEANDIITTNGGEI